MLISLTAPTEKRRRLALSLVLLLALPLAAACGESRTDDEEDEQGGDHVPDGKTYGVASLPDGTGRAGIRPVAYRSSLLAEEIHVGDHYRICLESDRFSEAELTAFAERLARRSADPDDQGLQTVVNETLATVDRFDGRQAAFSTRVTLDVVWSGGGPCDFVLTASAAADFPFDETAFAGQRLLYFRQGQLVTDRLRANAVPVGFVRTGLAGESLTTALQWLTGRYLGLAATDTGGGWLNPATVGATTGRWNIRGQDGAILQTRDALVAYTFALAFADRLKPTDLDRFHHYEDQLAPGDAATDPLLALPAKLAPIAYDDLPGNRYLYGVRRLAGSLPVCHSDQSDSAIKAEWLQTYLARLDDATPGGLAAELRQLDGAFGLKPALVDEGCALMVAFRTESQFPFAEHQNNGLYAHEGKVKDQAGRPTEIPVIYLNASALSLDPDAAGAGAAKDAAFVLEHEAGHFLGFKHSAEPDSILAPAGYHTRWPAEDAPMFREYLDAWTGTSRRLREAFDQ